MPETNYSWGSERPRARVRRLSGLLSKKADLRAQIEARHAREVAEFEALMALREEDLDEVHLMTKGGTSSYDRSLEADPRVVGRVRAENTQALYGRGARKTRATLPTQIIEVTDKSLSISEAVKAKVSKAKDGAIKHAKPAARIQVRATEAKPMLEMEPVKALPATGSKIVVPPRPEAEPEAASAISDVVTRVTLGGGIEGGNEISSGVASEPDGEVMTGPVEARSLALMEALARFEEAVLEWDRIDAGKAQIRESVARLVSAEQVDEITALVVSIPTVIVRKRFYLPDQEAMRIASMDFSRIPGGVDPTFGDHWAADPSTPPTEIFEEFPGCDLPWGAPYENLSENDAHRMWGLAIKDDADRSYVYPPMKWRQDVKFYRGVPTMLKTYASSLEVRGEEEAYRREVWELVIARRDLIKGLLRMLALGELTLDPASWRLRDRMRSVRYLVFRNSDFMFLLLMDVKMWPAYALCSVDKLPWLESFDRRSLIADFGGSMDPQVCPPIGAWDRLPLWLLPEEHYYHSLIFTPIDLDEVPVPVPNLKILPDRSAALPYEVGINHSFVFDKIVDLSVEGV